MMKAPTMKNQVNLNEMPDDYITEIETLKRIVALREAFERVSECEDVTLFLNTPRAGKYHSLFAHCLDDSIIHLLADRSELVIDNDVLDWCIPDIVQALRKAFGKHFGDDEYDALFVDSAIHMLLKHFHVIPKDTEKQANDDNTD